MTLHEAIITVLKDSGRPMSTDDIASSINLNSYYQNKNGQPLTGNQIFLRVKNYPSLFENINEIIVLTDDLHWKNIITNYFYLREVLRGYFHSSHIQQIIATLLFYRRWLDLSELKNLNYPINFLDETNSSIEKLLDGGRRWIERLSSIDNYHLAPDGTFREVADLLINLDSYRRETLLSIIRNIDTKPFNNWEFGNIYEYFLYQNTKEYQGYEHSTPETIRLLIPQLLNIRNNYNEITIYDPVSGIGGLLTKVLKNVNSSTVRLKGSEIINSIAQLGNMNLIMYGLEGNLIKTENCFEEINNDKKYDYIIGDLPINGVTDAFQNHILYEHFNLKPPTSGKGFSSLVLFSYYKLSSYGKAVVTVSDSFLTKGGKEKQIRKILLENDAIEAIISLPRGAYRPYTEAKASIIIINKDKPPYLRNKVKFIKASSLIENKKSLVINIDEVKNQYFKTLPDEKLTQIFDLSDIQDDLNLSGEVYDTQFSLANQMLKNGKARKIKDVVTIKSGVQPKKEELNINGSIPIIKIENLSKEILDINLDLAKISAKTDAYKYRNAIVNQSCILIAKIGESLKPTIFRNDNNTEILIHSGIFALIPRDPNIIDLEYLYYQLYTDFITEQIDLKRKGALIKYYNKKEIEDTIIPIESLKIQKESVMSQKINLITAETRRLEEKKEILGIVEEGKEAELNIVRTITHQLKHTLSGIDAQIKKIQEIVEINEVGDLKEYQDNDPILKAEEGFEVPENYTLKQTIDKVSKKSYSLNKILTDVKKAIHLELIFTEENLFNILNEVKDEFNNLNIEIKGDTNLNLRVSKSHIQDMFQTFINNAVQHSGLRKEKLKISFTVKNEDDIAKIEYRNNGKPLKISEEDYKSIATKSTDSDGSGIGGYYINKIIEAHSGILTIDESVTKGIKMNIELTIKHENNE